MNWRVRWTELEPAEHHRHAQIGTSNASLAAPANANYSAAWISQRDRDPRSSRLLSVAMAANNNPPSRHSGEVVDHLDVVINPSYKPNEVRCRFASILSFDNACGASCLRMLLNIKIACCVFLIAQPTLDNSENAKHATRHKPTPQSGEIMYAGQEFPHMCFYKGMVVWLRRITKMKLEFDTPRLMELKKLKDVNNNNVCRFIGLCIDAPNQCIVSEYCPRGSLRDILENDHIHLDWLFKFSLIQDIVRGMLYLHQNIGSHGHLTSGNCLVDTRFVLKITDFGLHSIRFNRQEDSFEAKQVAKNIARSTFCFALAIIDASLFSDPLNPFPPNTTETLGNCHSALSKFYRT